MHIAVLPGDDIGPEITAATMDVLTAAGHIFGLKLDFEVLENGMASHRKLGTTLPERALQAALAADGVILGPAGMTAYPPREEGGINVPGTIRKRLDLFANIRPAKSRPTLPEAREGLDCLIVRENTEGFYSDRNMVQGAAEFMPTEDCALSVRKITAKASRRIAEVAFAEAMGRRRSVTVVGKRHVLQLTDGLFMREVWDVARDYPQVSLREMDVDAAAAALYLQPRDFDVVLVTNMFGDILSNLAVGLSGGLGLSASLNSGADHAAANAGHGSAPDIAGKGVANPTGLILSAAMLLDWLGKRHRAQVNHDAAEAIRVAVDQALASPETRTKDLGGRGTISEFTRQVRTELENHAIDAGSLPA